MIGSADWWCRGFLVSNWRYLLSLYLDVDIYSHTRQDTTARYTHIHAQYTTHYTYTNTEPRVLLLLRASDETKKERNSPSNAPQEAAREQERESRRARRNFPLSALLPQLRMIWRYRPPTRPPACVLVRSMFMLLTVLN